MIYTLYVAENCHQCQEVVDGLKEMNIELQINNVDTGDPQPPIDVFAFPALFKDDILLRYGSDILTYYQK